MKDFAETVTMILNRKTALELDLQRTEKQLYDVETAYLIDHAPLHGSVLKSFECALSLNKPQQKKQQLRNKPEERAFSLSSRSSPVQVEVKAENELVRLATTASGRMTKKNR